jgi:D-alanine transaminase
MPELAYINGVFCPIGEAMVSIDDRGFQFGDGVYEVILSYDGHLFQLEPHIQRLRRSADAIQLTYDFDGRPLEPVIREGVKRCEFSDVMVYIQLTRGVAPRDHTMPNDCIPTVVMTFRARPQIPRQMRTDGVRLMTLLDTRWANCYVKAITLLPNILAKTEAVRRGYYDVVFVTATYEVRECSSSNIFIVRDGRLVFPPRTESVLHGVTQRFLLECAAGIDVPVDEQIFHVDLLRGADEVFMSSTVVEVLGVHSIDDQPIADGKVGPVTRRLYEEFQRRLPQSIRGTGS